MDPHFIAQMAQLLIDRDSLKRNQQNLHLASYHPYRYLFQNLKLHLLHQKRLCLTAFIRASKIKEKRYRVIIQRMWVEILLPQDGPTQAISKDLERKFNQLSEVVDYHYLLILISTPKTQILKIAFTLLIKFLPL